MNSSGLFKIAEACATKLDLIKDRSISRALEIIKEYSCENTRLANVGDLIYWQAWLSIIGFTFQQAVTEKEIFVFIIQHVEGLDPEVDKKLVEQRYKRKLGPHKLSTIKRRIISLSLFFDSLKWNNPCKSEAVKQLLFKLTKKYGESKPSGRAITSDILNDMLATCGDKIIDLRDKALLLFTWSSGGRRRSEVSLANLEDLTELDDGNFVYRIPQSKNDQEKRGHVVPINGRAAIELKAWLSASKAKQGPIFRSIKRDGVIGGRLWPNDVHRIVRRRLKKARYDETKYGAHSLRSGFVTTAGRHGKPIGDVMQMTTHRSVSILMKYYQAGNISNNSAANLID